MGGSLTAIIIRSDFLVNGKGPCMSMSMSMNMLKMIECRNEWLID